MTATPVLLYVVGYYRFIVEDKASKKRGRP